MAAIRKRIPPLTSPPKATLMGKSYQPPAFSAKGKGYFNAIPNFPADAKIANGVLINRATTLNNPLRRLYLFVDAVETGWTLTGQTSQAQASRSFYPRNMQQGELIIQGVVANQYESDRIVEFVAHHHMSQFNAGVIVQQGLDGNGNYPSVEFKLFRPQRGGTNQTPPMYVDMVITDIESGHERFMNFPTYNLTCKVIYDHLQRDESVDQSTAYWTTVQDVFGAVLPPVLSQGKDAPTGHTKPKKKRQTGPVGPMGPIG